MVKNLAASAGDEEVQVWSLGWEVPLEEGMATHSSILAWRIPWTEGPGGLQSMGSQRVGHHWATNTIKSYRHMYELHKTLGFLKFLLRSLQNRIWIMRFLKNNLKKTILSLGCWYSCNPMNCNLPGSSIHGILHARILEWVDISFSRGSSQPRDQTQVSRIAGWCFTDWATRKLPF